MMCSYVYNQRVGNDAGDSECWHDWIHCSIQNRSSFVIRWWPFGGVYRRERLLVPTSLRVEIRSSCFAMRWSFVCQREGLIPSPCWRESFLAMMMRRSSFVYQERRYYRTQSDGEQSRAEQNLKSWELVLFWDCQNWACRRWYQLWRLLLSNHSIVWPCVDSDSSRRDVR